MYYYSGSGLQLLREVGDHKPRLFFHADSKSSSEGPDAQESVQATVLSLTLSFFASELRLRGDADIAQPHRDISGNVLCWNGEVRPSVIINARMNL